MKANEPIDFSLSMGFICFNFFSKDWGGFFSLPDLLLLHRL